MPDPARITARPGGRGKCAACSSADLQAIDRALVAKVHYSVLVKRYRISKTSLVRHKQNHLSPALVAVHKADVVTGARTTLSEVQSECDNLRAIHEAARRTGNVLQAISASRALRGWTELKAKLTGELDERAQVVVNLQETAEWIQVQAVVVKFVDERLSAEDATELSRRLKVLDGGRR
jgi:hypothetical protein